MNFDMRRVTWIALGALVVGLLAGAALAQSGSSVVEPIIRVFEPIVGFSAGANASSLSWMIYNDLSGDAQLFGSAGATSVLTIVGVIILLMPVLVRTWREFNRKVV